MELQLYPFLTVQLYEVNSRPHISAALPLGKASYMPLNRAAFFKLFFKWGPVSLVRMFYGPPYSWDYETH